MTGAVASALAGRSVNWTRVLLLATLALLGAMLLAGLGFWQLDRRVWKLDLIHKVDARVHGAAHALPRTAATDPAAHEYEHVQVAGRYLQGVDTWVHASTVLGSGYWVLSPLRTDDGSLVLVNRGFVPGDLPRLSVPHESTARVTGLLRRSEPAGGWPRHNDPAQERWYSRDVAAIAAARGLQNVAPFFIDADATLPPAVSDTPAGGRLAGPVRPVGGLTVVHFRNSHLSYALTWFALALMTAVAGAYAVTTELLGHPRLP